MAPHFQDDVQGVDQYRASLHTSVAGGAGGGKPDSAMAGAKDDSKIPEALKKASEIVDAMLA